MFARLKNSGRYQYLQIVENHREGRKVVQRVISTIGRLDRLHAKGDVETLVRSLAKYSEKVLLVLSGESAPSAQSKKVGPSLIFERLWKELGIKKVIKRLLEWRRDYVIEGADNLSLHHIYRAMAFLGGEVADQKGATAFAPRCIKDVIEEDMFFERRNLFSGLDLVFFDTTSIYFEGAGGQSIGRRGNSKDHRPDLHQMVVGVIIDDDGTPMCCEMWPGNTTDVKTLIPIVDRLRERFRINRFCVVADRGMISADTMEKLEDPDRHIYILGARLRKVNEIKRDVLSRPGRYKEVYAEGKSSKDQAPLKVKEVWINDNRYVVCVNTKQARKDAADRKAIIDALAERIKKGPKGYYRGPRQNSCRSKI